MTGRKLYRSGKHRMIMVRAESDPVMVYWFRNSLMMNFVAGSGSTEGVTDRGSHR
jgi:hypothetical protein